MATPKWKPKLNRDGVVVPQCWVTDSGYTVARVFLPEPVLMITRPGGAEAFAYTPDAGEACALIVADLEACVAKDGVE
ncbi:hypothetical protein AO726_02720 [Pseudomonas sp. TTU2014-080ASC]|nr:hypothetical protein AO726_02720 [Pseudomonas sp. TTU2014-080ASC]